MVYSLGAMGGEGVSKMLEILRKELLITMGLAGVTSLDAINRDCVYKRDI